MRVLGISGSLRRDSHNTELLRAAATLLPSGVEFELYEGLKDVPPYDEDEDKAQVGSVQRLKEHIAAADAVLFATPEYNHSIPGHLKNALDWVSRPLADTPLKGKPVAQGTAIAILRSTSVLPARIRLSSAPAAEKERIR